MRRSLFMLAPGLSTAALALSLAGPAEAGVLERVHETGRFVVGVRSDAAPFARIGTDGEPAGFSVELCRKVAGAVADAVGRPIEVEVRYVSAADRFTRLAAGEVDLLCGPDTITLGRRAEIDFSIPTFVSGASLLYRADGPKRFEDLAGRKVGVLAGTTTEQLLARALESSRLAATIVTVADHEEGLRQLLAGELDAYFGDGAVLLYHWLASPGRERLKLSDRGLSVELYGLPVPKGDDDFRLLVDRTLAKLYRTGQIRRIFEASFGPAEPGPLVEQLWLLFGLGE